MRVPEFKDPTVTKFLNEFMLEMDRKEKDRMSSITANNSLLLYAPDKTVWEVKVSNAGVLTVARPVKLG